MKTKLKIAKEVEIKTIVVDAGVRYWEDANVNGVEDETGELIPFKVWDRWKPVIDIDNGTIKDWPLGVVANVHYKVCDDGIYKIIDDTGKEVYEFDGYVPSFMAPGGEGYGDYIIMSIDGSGKIDKWKTHLIANAITEELDEL